MNPFSKSTAKMMSSARVSFRKLVTSFSFSFHSSLLELVNRAYAVDALAIAAGVCVLLLFR